MPVLIDGSIFVVVCLVVGLGIFLAFEEVRQLQGRHTIAAAKDMVAVAAGVMMAAVAGVLWLSMALP
ncbi:MAG TPA: hypothetical protein VFP63_02925 [Dehalococcoidia bacterium]|nr:hypothetical protein [Dehalococcoidia bacterium]